MKDTTKNVDTNIFKSNAQFVHGLKADGIKPIWDRLLIRDIPDPDKIGSIFVPETAAERGLGKNGLLRLGLVVAVGPGDKFTREKVMRDNTTGAHYVKRKALGACLACKTPPYGWSADEWSMGCSACTGDGVRRWPMYCKVGDTVLYDRRKESELFIDGERFCLLHEEQAVMAVMEGA